MDDLLQKLLSFPPHPPPQTPLTDHAYDEAIRTQLSSLRNLSDLRLLAQTSSGESALDVINPALNSVPYAFILVAAFKASLRGAKGPTFEQVWDKATIFLVQFDPKQIRYVGEQFLQIVESVVAGARKSRQAHIAIPPIRDAILRIQPTGTVLTSLHIVLCELTLESRAFALALPVIDRDILYFPGVANQPKPKYICDLNLAPASYITANTHLTNKLKSNEVLEYFLHSGMIYIGLRDWERARVCLENAVTYPLRADAALSRIMVEAYKKWVLVGVLIEGKLPNLPRWTSNGAAKQYHILAKPYEAVAQLFDSASAARLKAEVDIGSSVWRTDFNVGLIMNVITAYQQFQIKNLGNIYTKISIPEIHNLTTSAETGNKLPSFQHVESLVREMITNRALRASLSNGSPPVLTFETSEPALSESQMQQELVDASRRIAVLTNEIKQTDKMLTHDKDYIKYYQKYTKNKDAMQSSVFTDSNMEWKEEDDEDLMGGVY